MHLVKTIICYFRLLCYKLIYRNIRNESPIRIEGNIEIMRGGEITIGKGTSIKKWVCLRPWGGKIQIGRNCSINSFCHISGNGNVVIGNNVLIASHCVIVSANHNFDRIDIPINEQSETRKQITIEDDCWIGAGVIVLAGVTIHHGSVIGAGSVVNKDIPAYSVVVGVPGRIIKKRDKESADKKSCL